MTCPKCGAIVKKDTDACEVCGASVKNRTTASPSRRRGAFVPIIVVLAAFLVVVGAAAITGYLTATNRHSTYIPAATPQASTPKKAPPYVLPYSVYVENGELILLDTETAMPYPVTTALGLSTDESKLPRVVFTKDGKSMFYADELNPQTGAFTLYYCATERIDAAPQKLAEDVTDFVTNAAGTAVMYIDGDGTLYRHDLTQKVRVGDLKTEQGKATAYLSVNGNSVAYINDEGRLYIKKGETDTLLVDEHVTMFYSNDASFTTVYYSKVADGVSGFYKKKDGYEPEKLIAGEADRVVSAGGGNFYVLMNTQAISLYELMEDDLSHDMPEPPEHPVRENYETDEAYAAAMAQYQADAAALKEAERLAIVRARLRSETVSMYTLWYFNGKKMTQADDWVHVTDDRCVGEKLVYSRMDYTAVTDRPKLSRVQDADSVREALLAAVPEEWYVAKADKPTGFKNGICYPQYSDDGTAFVYTAPAANGMHDVYQASLLDGAISACEVIGTAAHPETDGRLLGDGTYIWGDGTKIYENSQTVIEAYHSIVDTDKDSMRILYMTNWNDKDACGTLMLYTVGEEPVRIADDVVDAQLRADGAVVFLADYHADGRYGTLKLYKDEEITDISERVSVLGDGMLSSYVATVYGYSYMTVA